MKIRETAFSFLEHDCLQAFGQERGTAVFRQTETIYQELLDCETDTKNTVIQEHLRLKLFPPMAYYKALCAGGISKERALEYVREETRRAALVKQKEMKQLAGMPFTYHIYRMGVKKYMKKNFPEEGWDTEWVRCDGEEIHFNLRRCIYWEMTKKYECPELCCVYCENDDISFSGLMPKIRFERKGTLGKGADYCDFHFVKA